MQPGGARVRGVDQWQPVRSGLQMVFFSWLVNACSGLLYGIVFNLAIERTRGGAASESTWKLLDRFGTVAGFTDLAVMVMVAAGMFLVARAPAQARAGGLAMGGFGCALGTIAVSLVGLIEQFLRTVDAMREPLVPWRIARYVYSLEALLLIVAVVLFALALLKVATALRADDGAWMGIVALIAIPLAVLLANLPGFIQSVGRFRMDNRWVWFLLTRGIRTLGDVMFLLFLAHVIRATRRTARSA